MTTVFDYIGHRGKSRLLKTRRRGASRDPQGLVSRKGTVSELTESESNRDEPFTFLKKEKG